MDTVTVLCVKLLSSVVIYGASVEFPVFVSRNHIVVSLFMTVSLLFEYCKLHDLSHISKTSKFQDSAHLGTSESVSAGL